MTIRQRAITCGGGGNGASTSGDFNVADGRDGASNTGSGGGGAGGPTGNIDQEDCRGGNGGSGIIVVRYTV